MALGPILRRDPTDNANMQRWISQQVRLVRRQAGVREQDTADKMAARKAAYLAKLGLGDKAKEVKEAKPRPWHLDHMVEGDVFKGTFQHPTINLGSAVDVLLTVTSPTTGTWKSVKGDFEADVQIDQDFPIAHEKGEARNEAMAAYIFNKFNAGWRSFGKPMPSAEELEYLSLGGMRMFFKQVAEVDNFPEEADFNEGAADPEKGMTKAEFLKYILDEDPEYLEGSFPNVFTGRRVRVGDEDLLLDGDFQPEAPGWIFGYAYIEGKGGGSFNLELVKKVR